MYVWIHVLTGTLHLKLNKLVWQYVQMIHMPVMTQRNVWFYVLTVNMPMFITRYVWTNAISITVSTGITPPTCVLSNVHPRQICSLRRVLMNAYCRVRLDSMLTYRIEHVLIIAHHHTLLIVHLDLVFWNALSIKVPLLMKPSDSVHLPVPITPSMDQKLSIMLIHPQVDVLPCAHKHHRNYMATMKLIPAR